MKTIFNVILSLSFSGGILAALLLLIKPLLKDKLSKSLQYSLWLIVLLRLILPITFEINLTGLIFNRLPLEISQNQDKPVYEWVELNEEFSQGREGTFEIEEVRSITIGEADKILENSVGTHNSIGSVLINSIPFVWVLGFIISLAKYLVGYTRFVLFIRKNRIYASEEVEGLLEKICKQYGIKRKVSLYHSVFVPTPMLIGIIKPQIILPDSVYSKEQLKNILIHELTHFKRHDIETKWFATCVIALHWFNPILYRVRREINQACELACDEAVIEHLDTNGKQQYGETLIAVVAETSKNKIGAVSTTMCDEKMSLKERLIAIMKYKKQTKKVVIISMVIFATIILIAIALGGGPLTIGNNQKIEVQSEPEKESDLKQVGEEKAIDLVRGVYPIQEDHLIEVEYPVDINGEKYYQVYILSENEFTTTTMQIFGVDIDNGKVYLLNRVTGEYELYGTQEPMELETAIRKAIKEQGKNYMGGEFITEGHLILGLEEQVDTVKVYTLVSVGWFGFENGIFTKVSGSGAIPTVMTFTITEGGNYKLNRYEEPMDGGEFASSVKKMFPSEYYDIVLMPHKEYESLVIQQEQQAKYYLDNIGREAQVTANYVEKQLPIIEVNASNKLFSEFTKYDSFLNSFPYWIGTKERIEDGIRYIYETSQGKTSEGNDLIIFKKIEKEGTVVEERKYMIDGNEPKLIN